MIYRIKREPIRSSNKLRLIGNSRNGIRWSCMSCVNRNDRKLRLYLKLDAKWNMECPAADPADTARGSGKLIREIVANSRIYLPLWEESSTGSSSEGGGGVKRSAIGRASRYCSVPPSHPAVFTVCSVSQHFAGPECPKFLERSFLCVAIKEPLKRWFQLAVDSLLSSRDRYNFMRAEPLRGELRPI